MRVGNIAAVVMAISLVAFVAREAKGQTPDQENAAEDLHDAEAAAKRHQAELLKIPHVRVVTGEVDGQNEAAILVEVDEQKNVDEVTRQLPSQIEGFPVEVDEGESGGGDFTAFALPTPTPTAINLSGKSRHIGLKPSAPAPNPDAQQ